MNYSEKQSKINSDIKRRQNLAKDLKETKEGKIFKVKYTDEVNFDLDDVSQLDEMEEKYNNDSSSRKSITTNSHSDGNKLYIKSNLIRKD
jgi:hypothetical protein